MTTQMNDMPFDLSQSVSQVQTPRHPYSPLPMHPLAAPSRAPHSCLPVAPPSPRPLARCSMTCPSPSARTCRIPRRPAAGTTAAGGRFENRGPFCTASSAFHHFPLFAALFSAYPKTPKPHLNEK